MSQFRTELIEELLAAEKVGKKDDLSRMGRIVDAFIETVPHSYDLFKNVRGLEVIIEHRGSFLQDPPSLTQCLELVHKSYISGNPINQLNDMAAGIAALMVMFEARLETYANDPKNVNTDGSVARPEWVRKLGPGKARKK